MTSTLDFSGGTAPKSVRLIVFITAIFSLFLAFITPLYHEYVGYPGPQEIFSLSWYGIQNFWLWQLVTFLFLEPSLEGISFFYMINLAFMMYIIWLMGSEIAALLGEKALLTLYFSSGLGAGIVTLLASSMYGFIAGPTPAILAVLVVWTMLYPERELLLFFVLPLKAKWLTISIIVAILLVHISQGHFIVLLYYFTGILIGYGYAAFVWGLKMPFQGLRAVDQGFGKVVNLFGKRNSNSPQSKIVDFPTAKKVVDDEQFVDHMLAKISRYGEKSLTWQERDRLKKISERKSKNQL